MLVLAGGTVFGAHGGGQVSIEDMLVVLGTWGTPSGDLNADGTTDILDLLTVIAAWGPC